MDRPAARIEIDLYAGRPNPGWPLDAATGAAALDRIAALPRDPATPPPERLGYRGLLLHVGTLPPIRIGGGCIAAGDRLLADPDRRLERWLLATMPPALRAALPPLPPLPPLPL